MAFDKEVEMHARPIILLHGALGSKGQLSPLMDHLSTRHEVYSMDFAGHGADSYIGAYSIEKFADQILALLDRKEIEAAHIFGYSMGGYAALYLSSQHPGRVHSIFTLGTKFGWTPAFATAEIQKLNPTKIQEKVPKFATKLAQDHPAHHWKSVVDRTADMMRRLGEAPPLTEDILSRINTKTKICVGSLDKMVTLDESEATATQLASGEVQVIESLPHPIEKADALVLSDAITHFIASA